MVLVSPLGGERRVLVGAKPRKHGRIAMGNGADPGGRVAPGTGERRVLLCRGRGRYSTCCPTRGVEVRIQHISNGRIKAPNWGTTFGEVHISYRWE